MKYDLFECQYLCLLLRRLTKDRSNNLILPMVVIIFQNMHLLIPSLSIVVICIPSVDLWLTNHDLLFMLLIFLQAFLYSKVYRVEYWLTYDRIPSLFLIMIGIGFQRIDPYTFYTLSINFYYLSCPDLWLMSHDYFEYQLLSFVIIVMTFQRNPQLPSSYLKVFSINCHESMTHDLGSIVAIFDLHSSLYCYLFSIYAAHEL